jgi:hypothetical protein
MLTELESPLAAQQAEIERLRVQLRRTRCETHARLKNAYQTITVLIDMACQQEPFSITDVQQTGLILWAMALAHDVEIGEAVPETYPFVLATSFANRLQAGLTQRTGQLVEIVCTGEDFHLNPYKASSLAIVLSLLADGHAAEAARLPAGRTPACQVEMHASPIQVLVTIVAPCLPKGLDSLGEIPGEMIGACVKWDLQATARWKQGPSGGSLIWIEAPRGKWEPDSFVIP